MSTRKTIFNTVDDLVSDLLYYDRKDDENLGRGEIENAIFEGSITIDEIVDKFKAVLIGNL